MTTVTRDFLTPVIERFQARCKALERLSVSTTALSEARSNVTSVETDRFDTTVEKLEAGHVVVRMIQSTLREQIFADIRQAGFLIAREYIVEPARESDEPLYWVTGNRFFPPLRAIDAVDVVYQADIGDGISEGDMFEALIESIEEKCREEAIMMECPEDDNSVYAVDLRRWEYIGADFDASTTPPDSYNSEWRAKDGGN